MITKIKTYSTVRMPVSSSASLEDLRIALTYPPTRHNVATAETMNAKLKRMCSEDASSNVKNTTRLMPTSRYCTGWMKVRFSTSIKKNTRNVNTIKRIAYRIVRYDFW